MIETKMSDENFKKFNMLVQEGAMNYHPAKRSMPASLAKVAVFFVLAAAMVLVSSQGWTQTLWQKDMNGSLYVLQDINGVATVFGFPTENNTAKGQETYTVPGTVKIAVDANGNLYTLRKTTSGGNNSYSAYYNARGDYSAGQLLFRVTGGTSADAGNVDMAVSNYNKSGGHRVYVLMTRPTPTVYFNGALSGANAVVDGNLNNNSAHLTAMPYDNDPARGFPRDYVQITPSNSYALQALWKPMPDPSGRFTGTTGYRYQKVNNQVWMVRNPNGDPVSEGEKVNDVQTSIGDAFLDAQQYYRTRYNRRLSFADFNSGTGNQTLSNMLFSTSLSAIETTGWSNSWGTMGNDTQAIFHVATPNVLSGRDIGGTLIIYEPILKLNPAAILDGELHDPDGDNLAAEGYRRDDYVAIGYRQVTMPLSQYRNATVPFTYRSLHPITNQPTGNVVEVRVGHCYHEDPDATGEYGQFAYDNATTQAQIDSRSYPHAYSARLSGVDDVYVRVYDEGNGIYDVANFLAIKVTKTQYLESEYFAVSGADKDSSRTPDVYGNDYGDIYTLRRTYAPFRKDNPYVIPSGWADSRTNTSAGFPTTGYGLWWTLSILRETFYTLYQDDSRLSHQFPIGSSKFYQDACTVNCGCRGIAYGAPRQKSTPSSPIKDFAVVNIGMPPRPRGTLLTDILASPGSGDSFTTFYIAEDNTWSSVHNGQPWCWENWNGAQGTSTDIDGDGRAGGWPTNIFIDKTDPFWGRNPASSGIAGSPNPKNPSFVWSVRQTKPVAKAWETVNRGPIFDPGTYLFTDGGVYEVKVAMTCFVYDYERIVYPPFYWEESSALVAAADNDSRFGLDRRTHTITVKASSKIPNAAPGNLRIALLNYTSGSDAGTPSVTVDEDSELTFNDISASIGFRPAVYTLPNASVTLPRVADINSNNWMSSKIRFAPAKLPDNWRDGNPSTPADVTHQIDRFSGVIPDGTNRPRLRMTVSPAKWTGTQRYFGVRDIPDGTSVTGTDNGRADSPDLWVKEWDLVPIESSIEVGAGLSTPVTDRTKSYFDAFVTPYAKSNDATLSAAQRQAYSMTFPRLGITFNTPIRPKVYTVTMSLHYATRSWTPVYEVPGNSSTPIIDYDVVETVPAPATFSFTVAVNDRTAPVVKIFGGPTNNGNFPDIHTVSDYSSGLVWSYDTNEFSGATTGDEFPRMNEIKVEVTDNNPSYAEEFLLNPGLASFHEALLIYQNPSAPSPEPTDWQTFGLARSTTSVLDESGNPVVPNGKMENGEYLSRTVFTYTAAEKFRMPNSAKEVTYYAVASDNAGNAPVWTSNYGAVDGDAGNWGDYVPPGSTFLPKNLGTFELIPGVQSDSAGVPWASATIGILDNDPPDLTLTLQTQTNGVTVLEITGVPEPAAAGSLSDSEAFFDPTTWDGSKPVVNLPLTGFRLKVSNTSSAGVAAAPIETPAGLTEQDLYVYLPGGSRNAWDIDFSKDEPAYDKYDACFPLKILEDERFVISMKGNDNIDGEFKTEELVFADQTDETTGAVTAPKNSGIDFITYNESGSEIKRESLMVPYKAIIRDPTGSGLTQALRCWMSDSTGNTRAVIVPIQVFNTRLNVQTLEHN